MPKSTVKVALAVLLAVGLAAHYRATAGDEPPPAKKAGPSEPSLRSPWGDEKGPFTYAGRVVGPDGKPVAGAQLYLVYFTPTSLPAPARASSDAEGRFKVSVSRADFDRSYSASPWQRTSLVAVAPGYGLGVGGGFSSPLTPALLRFVTDDAPLRGRILDLEGKPVAGVTVRVAGLQVSRSERRGPDKGDLVGFVAALKDGQYFNLAKRDQLFGFGMVWAEHAVGALFPPVITGADGRFTIKGIGRERVAELRVEGPTITAQKVFAMTRPGITIRVALDREGPSPAHTITVYGSSFDLIAAPCKPVVGVVRDKDTGKPIPGAIVTNYVYAGHPSGGGPDLRAVADKEGRYRLLGVAKGKGNVLWAWPPRGEPYLSAEQKAPDTPGLDAVAVDFRLKRGVWLTGRVLDKVTRQPVRAEIEYGAFEDNPHHEDVRRVPHPPLLSRADDGTFRLVAVPGRGLLAAQAQQELARGPLVRYSQGVGADRIKGLGPNGYFTTYPRPFLVQQFHTFAEVSPAADAKEVTCDILLDPGRQLTVKVLGPDDKPLTGVRARGVDRMMGPRRFQAAEFPVSGVGPGGPRLLQFDHAVKNLAGSLVVKGDEKGPLTVKLVPAGVLSGRLVTPDGEPVTEGHIIASGGGLKVPVNREKPDRGTLPEQVRPDKDGKFRISGLAPGLKYRFHLVKGDYGYPVGGSGDLTFKSGETKALGDVVIKFDE